MNQYVTELGWEFSAAKMSLAQVSDVLFLILLPVMLSRLGYKKTIFIGQLYVDEEANERMRGAAQGLIAFILWGVGAFVGTNLAGISQQ
eukprot:gene17307-21159_t